MTKSNVIGLRFCNLVVIRVVSTFGGLECKCDCGTLVRTHLKALRDADAVMCQGCAQSRRRTP